MFKDNVNFNINLCAWGPKVSGALTLDGVTDMFFNTGCPNKTRPDVDANPPGPFCYNCP